MTFEGKYEKTPKQSPVCLPRSEGVSEVVRLPFITLLGPWCGVEHSVGCVVDIFGYFDFLKIKYISVYKIHISLYVSGEGWIYRNVSK